MQGLIGSSSCKQSALTDNSFVVRGDHRELWRSAPPGADDAPVEIEVPVSGIRNLPSPLLNSFQNSVTLRFQRNVTEDKLFITQFCYYDVSIYK